VPLTATAPALAVAEACIAINRAMVSRCDEDFSGHQYNIEQYLDNPVTFHIEEVEECLDSDLSSCFTSSADHQQIWFAAQ
jgi:hypothetical protein